MTYILDVMSFVSYTIPPALVTLITAPATTEVCQYVLVVVDVAVVKSNLGAKARRAGNTVVEVTWIVVVYEKPLSAHPT